ncbi:MAG: NADH-quinone oxidoreductase subunit L [Bacteroidota bacterium]|nr:NADH-quinone oxidoreductase subunit L [Bacteroidota bacterium]
MKTLTALVPLLPFISFLVIGLFFKRIPKLLTSVLACGTVLISFIFSIILFVDLKNGGTATNVTLFDWLPSANANIGFSLVVDQLSSLMLLVVTGVGFLIHVYSIGYMHDDEGFNRFFSYLNLFVFSMLILVMGSNYLMMFIGWEGVGLCSYLLIGFWFKNQDYNNAAKKAFIMNRIGDLGFLLGMFMLYIQFKSLDFNTIFSQTGQFQTGDTFITIATLLLFVGAIGKSAQIPLFTWLPDAMAGPTPVSALIHAATMVTAGIYMVARSHALYILAPTTLLIISLIGIATAIVAATIAIYQNDIKKVLAYSTVSQLGYMFIGLGAGAFTGAMFHLTTHAFFKALLFLAAGSVIHALGGEQDIRKMGGLKKKIPITWLVFLMGTIAISGIPPFSGFFSKDEILLHVYVQNKIIWALGILGSMMTAFYMFRLLFLTFFGSFRGTEDQKHHLHESPAVMTVPLIILAILSVIGGFINIPAVFGGASSLNNFLSPVFGTTQTSAPEVSHGTELGLMAIAVVGALALIAFAWARFVKANRIPAGEETQRYGLENILYHKYYIDEIYNLLIEKPILFLSSLLHKIDVFVIDRIVNEFGSVTVWLGARARLVQTGNIGFYLVAMVLSIVAFLVFGLMI